MPRHTVPPTSQLASYDLGASQTLIFPLRGHVEGESIRLHANLALLNGAGLPLDAAANDIYSGAWVSTAGGAHTLIDALFVEVDGTLVESINSYSHTAAAAFCGVESSRDTIRGAGSILEMRTGLESTFGPAISSSAAANDTDASQQLTFSIRPVCGLLSLPLIDAERHQVNLKLRLATTDAFCVLTSPAPATVRASLQNVYVSYSTWNAPAALELYKAIPSVRAAPLVTLITLPISLRSTQESVPLNINLPGPALGWFASFAPAGATTNQSLDAFAMYAPPALSRVRFLENGQDLAVRFPYQLAPITADPLMLYELAGRALAPLRLQKDGGGAVGARDRDETGAAFVIGQAYEPPIEFRGSSTWSLEIQSGTDENGSAIGAASPWVGWVSFIVGLPSPFK